MMYNCKQSLKSLVTCKCLGWSKIILLEYMI
uniref:Uncharacterized protein n=1 Tax=Anguilla anguilla TaxID=7936 RepID=A0A0E9XRJ5_ANGAN